MDAGFLDDLNLQLRKVFDEAAFTAVTTVQSQLKPIGLDINFVKSMAVAQKGYSFSDDECSRFDQLGIARRMRIDGSTNDSQRGFDTVDVPVDTTAFVCQHLRDQLLN